MTTKNGIIEVLRAVGFVKSNREARRLIEQGGVKLDGETIKDVDYVIMWTKEPQILQAGKRRFVKLI